MREEDEVLEPVELLCVSFGLINCDDVDVGETIWTGLDVVGDIAAAWGEGWAIVVAVLVAVIGGGVDVGVEGVLGFETEPLLSFSLKLIKYCLFHISIV